MTASKYLFVATRSSPSFEIFMLILRKKESLELTRVGRTRVYMIYCVDSHTFSTCRGGSTLVSNRVTRQDWLTRVTCKQLQVFDWRRVDPAPWRHGLTRLGELKRCKNLCKRSWKHVFDRPGLPVNPGSCKTAPERTS